VSGKQGSVELERRHRAGLSERGKSCVTQLTAAGLNLDQLTEDPLQHSRLDSVTSSLSEVAAPAIVQSFSSDLVLAIGERKVEESVADNASAST
jgi:hypothetical protein